MIKPTIGRVVWFYPGGLRDHAMEKQPHAALVVFVHSDGLINLAVFDENGVPYPRTSVSLLQEEDMNGEKTQMWPPSFATWMPYQIGQAKKHQ